MAFKPPELRGQNSQRLKLKAGLESVPHVGLAHSGGLFAEAQLLSQINLKASDEWTSLQGNLRDEGFLLLFFLILSLVG